MIISEWDYEGSNEQPLLEFEDSIRYGNKPWTEVGSIERKCDCIKEDNFDEKA